MEEESVDLSVAISEYVNGETRKMNVFMNKLMMTDSSSPEAAICINDCLRLHDEFPESLATTMYNTLLYSRPWYTFEPEISKKCISFLINLITHYDDLAHLLLSHFCEMMCSSISCSYSDTKFDKVEACFGGLREFLSSMPQFETLFVECLQQKAPGWGRPAPQLFSAVANILGLCFEFSGLFSDISIRKMFFICLNLLSNIEVNTTGSRHITDSSVEPVLSKLSDPYNIHEFETNKMELLRALTDKSPSAGPLFWLLSVTLLRIFSKKKDVALTKVEKKREWAHMCSLFRDLRDIFVQRILPIQATFTSFPLLLIFMASLRSGLVINLVESLWKCVKDSKQLDEVRIRCMQYLADYVARSNHCSVEVVSEQLFDLGAWCVEYTYYRKGQLSTSIKTMIREHRLFYIVFESIIYILTFRQAELFETHASRRTCASLPLVQLINSPFKPLDALKSTLRSHFEVVSLAYKMNWVITMPIAECPLDVDSHPRPSFDCPLQNALDSLPPTARPDLFRNFSFAKKTLKRSHENGDANSHASIASSDIDENLTNHRSKRFKPKYFNFSVLEDLT